jgi:hypothetical protein
MWAIKSAYKISVSKPEEERREDLKDIGMMEGRIKMSLRETGCEDVFDSCSSGYGPVAGSCEFGSIKGVSFLD